MFIIIVVCAFLLWSEFGKQDNFRKDVYYEIITGIIFTTLTVFIISLFNWLTGSKEIQEIQREDSLKQMMDLLSGNTPEKKSILDEIYSPEAAKNILDTALSRVNRRLAQGYSLIAACKTDVIRENFEYDVHIYSKDGSYRMGQNLSYKRYFKLQPNAPDECYLYCGFAFSTKGLNKLLEENMYFIREEITNKELIDKIREAATKKDKLFEENKNLWYTTRVVNAKTCLNLEIFTMQNGIERKAQDDKIEIQALTENGIKEIQDITDKNEIIGILLRTKVEYADEDDGMRSYKGRVHFTIPAPENKRFYCVFVDPVIGSTNFKFSIDPSLVNDIKDIEYVEILTRAGSDKSHFQEQHDCTMTFSTTDTILPKSAIITFW